MGHQQTQYDAEIWNVRNSYVHDTRDGKNKKINYNNNCSVNVMCVYEHTL